MGYARLLFGVLFTLGLTLRLAGQPAQTVSNTREMLEVMQMDASLLGQFVDDRAVVGNEEEPLLRLLFRLPSFAQVDLNRWSKPLDRALSLEATCAKERFEFVELRGLVERIEKIPIIPELVPRMGFSHYFKLTMADENTKSIVFVRELPAAWISPFEAGITILEPIRVQGLLLKKQPIDDQSGLVFAAARVEWYPVMESASLGVNEDKVLLSKMGVDIGQLDEVQHRAAMSGKDRESFYQLLSALHHAESAQLARLGRQEFDIARMIRTPEQAVGELYSLQGTARRAIRIHVDDADIRERFGIDHFFEVAVFVPMQRAVRFVDEDAKAHVFQDYPFVFCVPELPDEMPTGDDIRVEVQVSGFFLKLWAYRTEFMSEARTRGDQPARQLSPLLIGPTVVPLQDPPPDESQLSLVIAIAFVGALALVCFLLWRAGVQDRRRAQQLFEKNLPPDFANIDERVIRGE